MISVPFIHFYLPNGRQERETIELGDEVASKVQELHDAGCRLTAEVLSSGLCSFCVEHPEWGDFDIELCGNGPQVPKRITAMLLRFDLKQFNQWKEKQNE